MTLIKSISGIRGTIGGTPGDNLTPIDLVKFTTAYCGWLKETTGKERPKVVLGRDARISGEMVGSIVEGTLLGCGADVVNIGLASTPTTERDSATKRRAMRPEPTMPTLSVQSSDLRSSEDEIPGVRGRYTTWQ